MYRSLRVSLTTLLIALSLIPALAVGAALGWGIFQQERAQVLELERQVINQSAEMIATAVEHAEDEILSLIQKPALRGADATAREAVLSEALFYHETLDELAVADASGSERSRVARLGVAPPSELRNYAGDAIFLEPMRTIKTAYHGFEVSPVNGEPLLVMSVPTLSAQTGEPDGVVIAKVRMRQVFERVTSLPLGEGGTLMVLDDKGRLLAHPNLAALGNIAPPAAVDDGVAAGITGAQVLQVRRQLSLGNLPLTIGAELPLAEADAPLRANLALAALLLLAIAASATVFCITSTNRIARPITELAAATQRLSAGDTAGEVAVTRRDEIGALQRDFNQLVADLRAQRAAVDERTTDLQASLARQRDLLETVAQLSTPLLPVWEGVVVLPVVGHVDAQRGEALTTALIEGVARRRARVAIIDITGLTTINGEVVTTLLRAAQAVELLGAHAMLAGVSAAFARSIVATDLTLGKLESFRDLQSAAEAALGHRQDLPQLVQPVT